MIDYLIGAIRNIFRKKLRSFLTIAGIAIGIMSVVVISTIGEIGKSSIGSEIDSLGMSGLSIRAVRGDDRLFTAQLETVEALDGVLGAMPLMLQYTEGTMRGIKADCAVWGVDVGAQEIVSMKLCHGRYINKGDVAAKAKVCIIDESYAKKIYKRSNVVGKTVTLSMNGRAEEFEIIGVVVTGGSLVQGLIGNFVPCFLYLPYTTLKCYMGNSNFDQIAVKLTKEADPSQTAETIQRELSAFATEEGGVRVENLTAQREQLEGILEIIAVILSAIAGISLVVAGLSVMTVMLVSVNERTREIGIKKSIGASNRKICFEFMLEAFLISVIGTFMGLLLGLLLSGAGCLLFGVPLLTNREMLLFAAFFSVCVGVLFGAYPAALAAKLRPADALRWE